MFNKTPFFFVAIFLCVFASILPSIVLGSLLDRPSAVPFANVAAPLIMIAVAIYVVGKRHLRIGRSKRALMKYQEVLDAVIFGPGTVFFVTIWSLVGPATVVDGWQPLENWVLEMGLYGVGLFGLRFILRRTLFSPEERAEIDAKTKTRWAVVRAAQMGSNRYALGRLVGWRP